MVNVLLFALLKSQKKNEKKYVTFVQLVLTLIYKVKRKNKRYLCFHQIIRIFAFTYFSLNTLLEEVNTALKRNQL